MARERTEIIRRKKREEEIKMFVRATKFFVKYAEQYVPDPFLYAIILTFIAIIAALIWTPSSFVLITTAWYKGLWDILAFALQMALILVTGYTLAEAPLVKKGLSALARIPNSQVGAVITVFLVAAIASFLNWGFGLVVGALVAREIAKRLEKVDFAFLVAAAYMGFMVWASGLSSSIALATATKGSKLNIIEQITGKTMGLGSTVFTAYNLVPVVLLLLLMPFILKWMAPSDADMKTVDRSALMKQDRRDETRLTMNKQTFATRLENAWIINLLLFAMGVVYEISDISKNGFSLDINKFIFLMLMFGLLFHWTPIRYVMTFNRSARTVGPLLLQYPLYGGIMGIMTGTGLAGELAQGFVAFSTHRTLPFWSFISSNVISLFVPSGGGHWAVQGPFMVPAATKLGVNPGMTAMATAMGEQTANMIQPFWALPILAIARLGIRDIMGYCVIALIVGLVLFGGSLLIFA
jgi:short-chain fatty acids transporter